MHRILLVEDNEMNRDLISRRLKRRGFEISVAVDGAEGVERATAETPDLIVMDMGLPVLDGYEATRMLKDAEATRRIPVIGLSAHAMSGDARRALDAGCDDYDTKPVDWKRLLGKIDALLEKAQRAGSDAGSDGATPAPEPGAGDAAGHLLVADDNTLHREMLGGRLTALGYTYDLAAGTAAALELLEAKSFDAILLDVTLPRVDGQPLLERIRSDRRWRAIPVLLLSTIDAVGSAIDSLGDGADDFVPQPFHQPVLAARLDACLERRRLRRLEKQLAAESGRVRHLLETVLPGELIGELETSRKVLPRRCPAAAVLCCDLPGFAAAADRLEPLDAGRRLQRLVVAFEEILDRHRLEALPTGGTLVAAGGLFDAAGQPALDAVRCALELRDAAVAREAEWPPRLGLDFGPVLAGVVGHRKTHFDLWGTTAATAARVQRSATPGTVHVTDAVWRQVAEHCDGQPLGQVKREGGEPVTVYRVDGLKGSATGS